MANLLQMAQQFIQQVSQNNAVNNLADVPWRQEAINAITSGDQAKMQELGSNVLRSYGFSSPEEAIQHCLQKNNNGK